MKKFLNLLKHSSKIENVLFINGIAMSSVDHNFIFKFYITNISKYIVRSSISQE